MADETYRRFHSGRFGPETIEMDFDTKIEGAKGVTPSGKRKKKEEEEDASAPNDALNEDVGDQTVETDDVDVGYEG